MIVCNMKERFFETLGRGGVGEKDEVRGREASGNRCGHDTQVFDLHDYFRYFQLVLKLLGRLAAPGLRDIHAFMGFQFGKPVTPNNGY